MTNYDELKKAAEAAQKVEHYNCPWVLDRWGDKGAGVKSFNANICSFVPTAIATHVALANPATILALLAEREKLLKVVEAANEIMDYGTRIEYRDLADALKELDK